MQHLNEEQLVLHRYRDDAEDAGAIGEHLMACVECRAQYDTLCRVLALVDELPVPQRGDEYGTEVWNRLRWRLGRRERRRMWQAFATAATIALVFFAGGLWYARRNVGPGTAQPQIAQGGSPVASTPSSSTLASSTTSGGSGNRILLVVVSDHLDNSERMLLELTNADSRRGLDVTANRRRAEELVEANRLYRQTATQKGDSRIAALLSDLEPVLVELSHSSDRLSSAELASLQKRIDSKGLLFKVRVVSAQVSGRQAPTLPKGTNSL